MRNRRNKIERGSYSVEAALIMPIILFVIIALCYMAFYMHDKIRIQSIINSVVLKESMYLKHESNFDTGQILYGQIGERGIFYVIANHGTKDKKELEVYLDKQFKEGLLITQVESVKTEVQGIHIDVQVFSKVEFPFHKLRSYFLGTGENLEVKCRIQPHNPAEFVRVYTALNEVVSETNGFDIIREKLGKILSILS